MRDIGLSDEGFETVSLKLLLAKRAGKEAARVLPTLKIYDECPFELGLRKDHEKLLPDRSSMPDTWSDRAERYKMHVFLALSRRPVFHIARAKIYVKATGRTVRIPHRALPRLARRCAGHLSNERRQRNAQTLKTCT
jgi:hypothetical protein